jgi:hypothetical protein
VYHNSIPYILLNESKILFWFVDFTTVEKRAAKFELNKINDDNKHDVDAIQHEIEPMSPHVVIQIAWNLYRYLRAMPRPLFDETFSSRVLDIMGEFFTYIIEHLCNVI